MGDLPRLNAPGMDHRPVTPVESHPTQERSDTSSPARDPENDSYHTKLESSVGVSSLKDLSDTTIIDKDAMTTQSKAPELAIEASTPPDPPANYVKDTKAYLILSYLTYVNVMTSFSTGLITTGLPTIGRDIGIPAKTMYWPLAVYSLTMGACLILAGSIADIVGSRRVFLVGTVLFCAFTLGCGLASTAMQLVMFRAMQGVAVAMCLPASVGIICQSIAPGRLRNLAFACTGAGQVFGFSLGLILSGVFIKTVGWRSGWYFATGLISICCPVGFMLLPRDILATPPSWARVWKQVDWPGALIESSCFAMLAYVLVQISEDRDLVRTPLVVVLLTVGLILMPVFVWWMSYASKHALPVLIPNKLWRSVTFTTVCIMVMMSYTVMQALELYATLFFQEVQGLDALQSSLQMMPSMIVAAVLNVVIGLFIHRVSVKWLVFVTSIICSGSPLIMALVQPGWPYWYAAFPAQIFHPFSADVLFCVGLIVISQVFPENTQALAGAVFNTVAQFGIAFGIALIAILADGVTESSAYEDKKSPEALMEGYRSAFWATFAFTMAIAGLALVGLRGVGTANDVKEIE